MSVSTEVQRTLVKSPPELWAELSSPEALARHLSDLGEIRITSLEPETKVEWESNGANGVVHLKQSGWGTRVTLSVTREAPPHNAASEPEALAVDKPESISEPEVEPKSVIEPEPVAVVEPEPEPTLEPVAVVEPEPEPTLEPVAVVEPEPEPTLEPVAVVEPEPIAATPKSETTAEPKPRVGFFARLFRKRQAKPTAIADPAPGPIAATEPEVEPEPEPEVIALAAPEPIYPMPPPAPEPIADLAAELASMEAQMEQETTELLTGVLDRLGAAHHRPFSRG
jgi:hypothetical protein